jgi:leucyl aminopeptidase (aminopeptidase T)
MPKNPNDRLTVQIKTVRIPLRKLLHGKEIRAAAKALEDFRTKLNEQEILYGAKLTIDWQNYDECHLIARRPETDDEYAARLERRRIAEELKARREAERAAAAVKRAEMEEFRRRADAVEQMRKTVKQLGLSAKDLVDLLVK